MQRTLIALFASIILVPILVPATASAQSARNAPFWLLFDQGNAFMEKHEFGDALQKYQQAIVANNNFPEAEMAIGDIYRIEGETDLALRQYQKAYNLRKNFYIEESQYDVLYKLARVYESQGLYKQMEDSLQTILLDDKSFNEPKTSHIREQIELNYYGKGLDYVLKLYRLNGQFASEAHSKLGWFYYKTGRFSQSALHLVYSLIYKITISSEYAHENDVDYQFSTLADFFDLANSVEPIMSYLKGADIGKDLYYLAGSTFAAGYPKHSMQIWELLSKSSLAGKYGNLSKRQLKSPFIEPYLQAASKLNKNQ